MKRPRPVGSCMRHEPPQTVVVPQSDVQTVQTDDELLMD